MPGSVTAVFGEAEDFAAALRAEGVLSLLVTGAGEFRAQLTQIALNQLRLSAAEERLPRIALVAVPADTIPCFARQGRGIGADLGRSAVASGRDHDPRGAPAPAHADRRALPLGVDLVAGRGTPTLRQRVDRSRLRASVRSPIVAVAAGDDQAFAPFSFCWH